MVYFFSFFRLWSLEGSVVSSVVWLALTSLVPGFIVLFLVLFYPSTAFPFLLPRTWLAPFLQKTDQGADFSTEGNYFVPSTLDPQALAHILGQWAVFSRSLTARLSFVLVVFLFVRSRLNTYEAALWVRFSAFTFISFTSFLRRIVDLAELPAQLFQFLPLPLNGSTTLRDLAAPLRDLHQIAIDLRETRFLSAFLLSLFFYKGSIIGFALSASLRRWALRCASVVFPFYFLGGEGITDLVRVVFALFCTEVTFFLFCLFARLASLTTQSQTIFCLFI